MSLSFLPNDVKSGIERLNLNFVTEIRLRRGQPVIIGYKGEYQYLGITGLCDKRNAIVMSEVSQIIAAATEGCIYNYSEQIKSGFITCGHGVRIGLAGEYVTDSGEISTISNLTSLNIRIPHDVKGCAASVCETLFKDDVKSTLIFSIPGLGKTTMLRDVARFLSDERKCNVLVFDERNEIAAMDSAGNGFEIGERTDVIRSGNKLCAFSSAIRAMKPDVIITDELYGEEDLKAVKYAADCGIAVIASSHVTDVETLKAMPFEFYAEIRKFCGQPFIYDKNFNPYSRSGSDDGNRRVFIGEQKEENANLFRTV